MVGLRTAGDNERVALMQASLLMNRSQIRHEEAKKLLLPPSCPIFRLAARSDGSRGSIASTNAELRQKAKLAISS